MTFRIPVLYEDNHVLVVVKPPGMPTQADRTGALDLLNALKADLKIRYAKPGDAFLGLVHRLDRPVGGVMVFAKTSKAASRLSEQVRSRAISKTYLAIVCGARLPEAATLTHHLYKDVRTNRVAVVPADHPGAKLAVLDYVRLQTARAPDRGDPLHLVRIELHTGRPHQIRAQFAAIGHPVFGDAKYGSHAAGRFAAEDARAYRIENGHLALWSYRLAFAHPTTRHELTFTAKPPETPPWTWFDRSRLA